MLETKSKFSARAVSALNHWDISFAPQIKYFKTTHFIVAIVVVAILVWVFLCSYSWPRTCYIDQDGLEFTEIFLPPAPQCWDYRSVPHSRHNMLLLNDVSFLPPIDEYHHPFFWRLSTCVHFCLGIGYPLKSLLNCILFLPQNGERFNCRSRSGFSGHLVLRLFYIRYKVVVWRGGVCW